MKSNHPVTALTALLLTFSLISCRAEVELPSTSSTSHSGVKSSVTSAVVPSLTPDKPVASTMSWDADRILPSFSPPEGTLDALTTNMLSDDELVFYSTLQGIVNRSGAKLLLFDDGADEGSQTWAKTFGLEYNIANGAKRYTLYKEYMTHVSGCVLYSAAKSEHYVNLACSVANTMNAVPLTKELHDTLSRRGIVFPILADLTGLTYTTPEKIYTYLYDNYWDDCTHRLIFSQRSGDRYHLRDLAAATGSALVWFDCTNRTEKQVFDKFLTDMELGKSACVGFYSSERGGITTATAKGITTIPGDFFSNATVWADSSAYVIPSVPDMAENVENKIYIAAFVSDGDNAQYVERAMRKIWDSTTNRTIPINWTITPSLVDLAPGMLNYYYTNATPNDCMVCGPSGMGYFMTYNTLGEDTRAGVFLQDNEKFTAYAEMSQRYLQMAGLRSVTVWDRFTDEQEKIFFDEVPYLYGITEQVWGANRATINKVVSDKYVTQLTPCYESAYDALLNNVKTSIGSWDKCSPRFVSCQLQVWSELAPNKNPLTSLKKDLESVYGEGTVEFVRADHYFNLYYMANGLPYDLTLLPSVTATADVGEETAVNVLDGSPSATHAWEADTDSGTLTVDLGKIYDLRSITLHLTDPSDETAKPAAEYIVSLSSDGQSYTEAVAVSDNAASDPVHELDGTARYISIRLSGSVRIGCLDIWGK